MRRQLARGALVAILVGTSAAAHAAHVPAREDAVPSPLLDIKVDPSIEDGDLVHDWLLGEGRRLLEIHRFDPDAALASKRLVEIAVRGSAYEYIVEIAVREGDAIVGDRVEPIACECGVEELIKTTMRGIVDVLPRLRDEPAAEDTPVEDDPPVEDPPNGTSEGRRLGPMGAAGIGVLVSGVALTATGIGLTVSGERTADDRDLGSSVTDLRPAGYALLGVGAAAMVTGAVLLAVAPRRSRRSAVAPSMSPTSLGFVVLHRF